MTVRHKMIKPYMETARAFARLSRAKRLKVGGVAVTPQDVMLFSWNGTAEGEDNNCEDADGNTRPEVLHCEANIVAKAAREGLSLKGAGVYVTASPCLACAKLLKQVGITTVIYDDEYRLTDGIDYLRARGVYCEKFEDDV